MELCWRARGSLGKELAPSAALWGADQGQGTLVGQGPVWGGEHAVSVIYEGGPCFSRSGLHRWRRAGVSSQLWGSGHIQAPLAPMDLF